nr:hypothetical protein [Tanacetum cinerariifolium]
MSVLKRHSGWKTKHFKGMTLDEIREKFIPVWKQIEDFIPMGTKEEEERLKRKGLRLEQESTKKVKTSEEVSEEDLNNKDKKNRLMRIDEPHKFSDGTLNDVCNALDDHLKGIQMQYLPSTIWRKGDKDRAAAMIQAIEKMLKMRRIMRSL